MRFIGILKKGLTEITYKGNIVSPSVDTISIIGNTKEEILELINIEEYSHHWFMEDILDAPIKRRKKIPKILWVLLGSLIVFTGLYFLTDILAIILGIGFYLGVFTHTFIK